MSELSAEIITGDPLLSIINEENILVPFITALDCELASRNTQLLPGAKYEFTPFVLASDSNLHLHGVRFVELGQARLEQSATFGFAVETNRDEHFLVSDRGDNDTGFRAYQLYELNFMIINSLKSIALRHAGQSN